MDLRQLECFVAVAEELNFRRAARRVHISQPPLSRQISRLEGDLGVRLLDRSPQGVALTAAGKAFLSEAQKLLVLAASAPEVARRADRGETGILRIGFVGSTIYTSVPTLVGRFRLAYPHVDIRLSQLTVARQVNMLLCGDIDVGVIRQSIKLPDLATRRLFKEPFVAALPAHHRLATLPAIALQQLALEPFVSFSKQEAPAISEQLVETCHAAGFAPNIVLEAHPMSTVVGLVASGAGVAIVPASMQRLQIENVVYKTLVGTHAVSEFFLAWGRGNDCVTLKRFLELVPDDA